MARSKFWKRFFEGLKRTANIIAVTVLLVASVLTFDWMLLVVGAAIELVYLAGYILWPSLPASFLAKSALLCEYGDSSAESSNRGAINRLPQYLLAAPARRSVTFLDGVLLVVTVIGFVVILFFGFGKHMLDHPWPYLTHAEGWDAGAIIWTSFFLLYYTVKFPFTKDRKVDKAIVIIIAWGSSPLLYLAGVSTDRPIKHVLYVWLIGVCFFVIDLLIWKRHPEQEEQDLSKRYSDGGCIRRTPRLFVVPPRRRAPRRFRLRRGLVPAPHVERGFHSHGVRIAAAPQNGNPHS
jgi:hypothetical protein